LNYLQNLNLVIWIFWQGFEIIKFDFKFWWVFFIKLGLSFLLWSKKMTHQRNKRLLNQLHFEKKGLKSYDLLASFMSHWGQQSLKNIIASQPTIARKFSQRKLYLFQKINDDEKWSIQNIYFIWKQHFTFAFEMFSNSGSKAVELTEKHFVYSLNYRKVKVE